MKQKPIPTEDSPKLIDPLDMNPEQRLHYIARLEEALGKASTQLKTATASPEEWKAGEKRFVMIQAPLPGYPIRINGRPYVGRMEVTADEYSTVMEMYNSTIKSELSRMQQRGNLVAPHLLPHDDITSRSQPTVIAHL